MNVHAGNSERRETHLSIREKSSELYDQGSEHREKSLMLQPQIYNLRDLGLTLSEGGVIPLTATLRERILY